MVVGNITVTAASLAREERSAYSCGSRNRGFSTRTCLPCSIAKSMSAGFGSSGTQSKTASYESSGTSESRRSQLPYYGINVINWCVLMIACRLTPWIPIPTTKALMRSLMPSQAIQSVDHKIRRHRDVSLKFTLQAGRYRANDRSNYSLPVATWLA